MEEGSAGEVVAGSREGMFKWACLLGVLAAVVTAVPLSRSRSRTLHGYDENLALLAYQYAKASYCSLDDISECVVLCVGDGADNWTCAACGNRTANFKTLWSTESKGLHIQSYVGIDSGNNFVVVAFRGSADITNW